MMNDVSLIDFIEATYPEGLPHEIVFYGGSFNPWHEGHQEALNKMSDKHVIVIPDRNPLKPINPFSLEESEEKIKASLGIYHWLYMGFLNKRTHNPTQIWVNEIRKRHPLLKISFLMGFDNFAILDKWFNAEKLLKDLNSIYILSRNDDESVMESQTRKVKDVNQNIDLIFLGKHPYEGVSSTKIRENLLLDEGKSNEFIMAI